MLLQYKMFTWLDVWKLSERVLFVFCVPVVNVRLIYVTELPTVQSRLQEKSSEWDQHGLMKPVTSLSTAICAENSSIRSTYVPVVAI